MSYRYRLAIFDLDGTVLDTLDDLADSVNAVLAANGYPTHTKQTVCSFVGNGIKKLIERAVPPYAGQQDIARVYEAFVTHYMAHCAEKTAPYEGIVAMLQALRAAGVKTAVLSNKADRATRALCKIYFAGLLDVVAGEREGQGPGAQALADVAEEDGHGDADEGEAPVAAQLVTKTRPHSSNTSSRRRPAARRAAYSPNNRLSTPSPSLQTSPASGRCSRPRPSRCC